MWLSRHSCGTLAKGELIRLAAGNRPLSRVGTSGTHLLNLDTGVCLDLKQSLEIVPLCSKMNRL